MTIDVAAIRELLTLVPEMRQQGVAQLSVGGVSLVLHQHAPPSDMPPAAPDIEPEVAEADRAALVEQRMKASWDAYWRRMLASSGSPVPPFPGVEKALRVVGDLPRTH